MLHLGSIRGTSIDVDLSFFILCLFFVATNYNAQRGVQYALLWIPVLFLSVLVHELAHAGTIGIFGYGSSHVVLGGMGGVTINERRSRPIHDMLISLAGPFSSFALAFVLSMLQPRIAFLHTDPMMVALVPMLIWANVAWGILNLVPVAPLDGGKAVRSFFSTFLKDGQSFLISVWIGMVVGTAVAVYGLMNRQFFLAVIIGFLVYRNFVAWQYFREHGVPGD
ncbi:MAG TPA: M50 family metallopeptidase [Thermoanaerobaculia bacterium]|jgi:Zn-dependent protease